MSSNIRFIIFLLTVLFFIPNPLFAGKGGPAHEFYHYLHSKDLSQRSVSAKLGEPSRKVRKLGGWEYWYYDAVMFQEARLDLEEAAGFSYLVFKNGQLIPPSTFYRRQKQAVRTLFLPVTLLCRIPFGSYLVIPLSVLFFLGAIKTRGILKIFLIYLLLGCLLVYGGVIF